MEEVPTVETFVEKTKEFEPQVVGLSGFLTLAFDSMKKTVEALEQAGLRDFIKIMIGGGQKMIRSANMSAPMPTGRTPSQQSTSAGSGSAHKQMA